MMCVDIWIDYLDDVPFLQFEDLSSHLDGALQTNAVLFLKVIYFPGLSFYCLLISGSIT